MKKIHLILFFIIGIFVFNSCHKDSDEQKFEFGDLPLSSQEFLTKYFPNNQVVSISHDCPQTLSGTQGSTDSNIAYIYVRLDDHTDVVFFRNSGAWISVSAEKEIPLSATKILDEYVYERLKRKEPQARITALSSVYEHSIMITLDNTHRYAQSRLLAYNGVTLAEADITDDVNFKIKLEAFLKRDKLETLGSIGHIFKITEEEGTAYRLFVGNALIISFNENGDWIHAEINEPADEMETRGAVTVLNRIAENEIPASMANIFNTQSNLGNIQIMASYGNGNYGFRFKNKDMLVNEITGIVTPPIAAAQQLITDYYDSSYKPLYPGGITLVGAYQYSYTFVFVGKDNSVSIETDMTGKWTAINASYIQGGKAVYISLPKNMIDELLPAQAIAYLNENYKDGEIYGLIHQHGGYHVNVNKQCVIYFNEDGSYRTTLEYSFL